MTFPRLCRDRIELRYFLTQRQECIGLAGGPETHTHASAQKKTKECSPAQNQHPVIACPKLFLQLYPLIPSSAHLVSGHLCGQCVGSRRRVVVGAQQRLGGIGCQRDKARLSKLRPAARYPESCLMRETEENKGSSEDGGGDARWKSKDKRQAKIQRMEQK